MFLNLFLNARDAMENGGTLAVKTARSQDRQVRVTVADSGAGIAAENLTRIFDPFFTTKAAKKGTGLGLSVSYGIVKEHGGEIEVASELGRRNALRALVPGAGGRDQARAARGPAAVRNPRRCRRFRPPPSAPFPRLAFPPPAKPWHNRINIIQ